MTIRRLAVGFALSVLLIWAITSIATPNLFSTVWSEELNQNIPVPNTKINAREENWATTHCGQLGLLGTPKVEDDSIPKILIWGDSFVAASQVEDENKMHRQLGKMLNTSSNAPVQAIGVGRPYQSFADYIFKIPIYEELIQPVALNVIHLHTLNDMYPDQPDGVSLFLSKPNLHFVRYDNEYQQIESPVEFSATKDFVYQMRLHFFVRLKKQITQIARLDGLRFSLGNQSKKHGEVTEDLDQSIHYSDADKALNPSPVEAWEFALDSLRETTDVPVLFVYAPKTPYIEKGRVFEQDPEANMVQIFEKLCRERGFSFVNLQDSFLDFYHETGSFHRGFVTSRPWAGHYNENGHHLVAQSIHNWIKEHPDVVHPN